MPNQNIKVYFDGLCVVCSKEIEQYKKMKGAEKINFIDIADPSFDCALEGLDPFAINKELHSKDAEGKIHVGVDTFILIWSNIDKLNWLAKLAQTSIVNFILQKNYILFTKIRPYLPRKSCETSPYCEIKTQ